MENPRELLQFTRKNKLPLIFQTEAAECGLACIAMISCYFGNRIDLNQLRIKHTISLKGTRLHDLINISDKLKLNSQAVRLEPNEMRNLNVPTILHWDMNHFVVLKKATKKGVEIYDPAQGKKFYSYSDVSKHFTGVALQLTPNLKFKKKDERVKLRFGDFWQKLIGLKRSLIKIFILSLLLQVFTLVGPYYMQLVVDQVLISNDTNLLVILAFGFGLLVIFEVITKVLRSFVSLHMTNMLSIQMGSNLFHHLIRLPLSYFEKRHIGDIVSRFGSLRKINNLLTKDLMAALLDGIMAIAILLVIFIYSVKLSLVVLSAITIYAIIRLLLYKKLRILTEESIIATANEQSNFMETIRGIQCIKLFGCEIQRQSLWHNRISERLNTGIRLGKVNIGYNAINQLLFGFENVIVVYFAALLVIDGELSIGMLFAFMAYKSKFTGRMTNLIEKFIQFKILGLHLERLSDIALNDKEAHLDSDISNTKIEGSLSLKNITFSYSVPEQPILENLDFSINKGESVAIVGASGCGKTTLLKIMLGLFEPETGVVSLCGIDIKKLGLNQYRSQIAAVMQNDQLLSGSIRENISFFDSEFDSELVEMSAKLAGIHQDIRAMPMGYNSLVGDMGSSLSGGQKQRVLLARALYRKPKILLLDEATSHLDTKLESKVNEAINKLSITRIIIAHRPETILMAQRVFKLNKGKLIEITKQMKTKMEVLT